MLHLSSNRLPLLLALLLILALLATSLPADVLAAAQGETTPEVTEEPTLTATVTALPTETPTETASSTATMTETATLSPSATATATQESLATETPTATVSPTATATSDVAPTPSATMTPRITATPFIDEAPPEDGLLSGNTVYVDADTTVELINGVNDARTNPNDLYVIRLSPGTYTLDDQTFSITSYTHSSYLPVRNGKVIIVGVSSYLAGTHPGMSAENAIIQQGVNGAQFDFWNITGSGSLTLYNLVVLNGGGTNRWGGGGFVNGGELNIYLDC